MRPLRLVLFLSTFILFTVLFTFLSLRSAHPENTPTTASNDLSQQSRLRALFSFHTPSSLFPPSAIISLTDDNSTFFLARPAAFGPLLPGKGLSGRLWVGSGFGDDELRRGGISSGAEGELGCSDVPGWSEGDKKSITEPTLDPGLKQKTSTQQIDGKTGNRKRSGELEDTSFIWTAHNIDPSMHLEDDGTDDHLHHPLPESQLSKPAKPGQIAQHDSVSDTKNPPAHADIQSLQEGAEIAGKVVLLSRGGCGFLEKVKWVQRRGGIALIVGDNTRGGGLVTMYARGDTSNVTIPSLFTSHTTAHLLSSLIPPEGLIDDIVAEDGSLSKSSKTDSKRKGSKKSKPREGTTFTPSSAIPRPTSTVRSSSPASKPKKYVTTNPETSFQTNNNQGWFRSFFTALGFVRASGSPSRLTEDSRRPPTSGHLDWVLADEWYEDDIESAASNKDPEKGQDKNLKLNGFSSSGKQHSAADDFVIGVQDWRDPDVIHSDTDPLYRSSEKGKTEKQNLQSTGSGKDQQVGSDRDSTTGKVQPGNTAFKGGSITPGSGEYENPQMHSDGGFKKGPPVIGGNFKELAKSQPDLNSGWFRHLWNTNNGDHGDVQHTKPDIMASVSSMSGNQANNINEPDFLTDDDYEEDEPEEHDGLWVTLTPTSISTSPFFDTLLVLVVSPLVTLTFVYALLLIRSRIRRRRWRAPKSVVDRLPIRTYQTISYSSSTTPSTPSPASSSPSSSPRQSNIRAFSGVSRPRSQTTTGVLLPSTPSINTTNNSGRKNPHEKNKSNLSPWKRKYASRQVECAVCLEEYIDGHSRVMSLPCGHEFHAECITPWLTTRRRTCPICKGDVVRSMAHGSTHTIHGSRPQDISDDEVQSQIAQTRNESPSSAIPLLRDIDEDPLDIERGDNISEIDSLDGRGSQSRWQEYISQTLLGIRDQIFRRQPQTDRDR
ncbi:MAG: hypothetical protein M1834_003369 [Cirrosporium novae-zelandiae]|nr:MAG: hypothetical protein M1834_003369 [Cirrosporium novae-zelandiae]